MRTVLHLVRKELLVLTRDMHALLLLFFMPAAFIVVMSVALRDRFAADQGAPLTYYLVNQDTHATSDSLAVAIRTSPNIRAIFSGSNVEQLRDSVARDKSHFLVVIPDGFGTSMTDSVPLPVAVYAGPAVDAASSQLFAALVHRAVARVYLARSLSTLDVVARMTGGRGARADSGGRINLDAVDALVSMRLPFRGAQTARPTSVQQNVPGWLLFAMFFVALPLSTTWVDERRQGTFARLRSLGVSPAALIWGKMLPYFAINWIQCAVMLAVGVVVVPMFGGDALTLGHSPAGLALMVLAVSFAAVSYALLIANAVSTTAEATILTGVGNLLLAVVGGVMVPRFVMPAAMQTASLFSPMAWGLEGFLDIFLRRGTLATVVPWAMYLFAFGAVALLVAGVLLGRDVRRFRI